VEIVNKVPCFPEGVPPDIDKPYGSMPLRHRYRSPRRKEYDNAPMEWMPFLRWASVYASDYDTRRMLGKEMLIAYWRETCDDADKIERCRKGVDNRGLEVLMSNRWKGVPVFQV